LTLSLASSPGTSAAVPSADCATMAFHCSVDAGWKLQVCDIGAAINFCTSGLTVAGTGNIRAGTSRPASAAITSSVMAIAASRKAAAIRIFIEGLRWSLLRVIVYQFVSVRPGRAALPTRGKLPAVTDNAPSTPLLVLLPGLDGTGKLFGEFVKAVASRLDSVIVAYPTDEPLGYEELEPLVTAALPKDRPFALLGESFSGPLSIRIAGKGPEGLVGLILCGTFAKNPYPGLGWARPLAAYLPVKSLPRWVRAPLMWGSLSPDRATSQMERAMSGVAAPVVRRRIAAILSVDETESLRGLRIPTLVLRATRDRVISKASTRRIMKILGHAELAEVDGPHLLLQTRAAECAAIVIDFMRRL
jgi:pimeloyl-ACP methyl ester carboxylesterase